MKMKVIFLPWKNFSTELGTRNLLLLLLFVDFMAICEKFGFWWLCWTRWVTKGDLNLKIFFKNNLCFLQILKKKNNNKNVYFYASLKTRKMKKHHLSWSFYTKILVISSFRFKKFNILNIFVEKFKEIENGAKLESSQKPSIILTNLLIFLQIFKKKSYYRTTHPPRPFPQNFSTP